jgi:hypothetical protein
MPMFSRRVVLGAGLLAPAFAYGQGFPSRNITIIVPFAPGASSDGIGRLIGDKLGEAFGKPSIIDNRPGGGGTTGLTALARSAPDGHTLGIGAPGALLITRRFPNVHRIFIRAVRSAVLSRRLDRAPSGAGLRNLEPRKPVPVRGEFLRHRRRPNRLSIAAISPCTAALFLPDRAALAIS